jgi:hypothetical protein
MPIIEVLKLIPDSQIVEIEIADYSFSFCDSIKNLNFDDCQDLCVLGMYSFFDNDKYIDYIHIDTKRMEGDKNAEQQTE